MSTLSKLTVRCNAMTKNNKQKVLNEFWGDPANLIQRFLQKIRKNSHEISQEKQK